jgi:hypothetical protein
MLEPRMRLSHSLQICAACVISVLAASGVLFAVQAQSPPTKPGASVEPKAPAAPQQVVLPDNAKTLLLIRITLLTLNDALYTGNYTVLRDRGSPAFQAANTSAKLSQIFANLASQQVDLSPVAVLTPQLTQPPSFGEQNRLYLKGFFQDQPMQINFEMLFEPVGGQWRLFGLSVQPVAAPKSPGPTPPATAKKPETTVPKKPPDAPKN